MSTTQPAVHAGVNPALVRAATSAVNGAVDELGAAERVQRNVRENAEGAGSLGSSPGERKLDSAPPPPGAAEPLQINAITQRYQSSNSASDAEAAQWAPRVRPGARPRNGLSDQQQSAAHQVALGQADRAVAESIGVHRKTVTRWRLYDVQFRSEVAARRQQLFADDRARFRSAFEMAMTVLMGQMQSSCAVTSHRAARTVLMLAQRFMPQPPPSPQEQDSPDPDEILVQHARHMKRSDASKDPGARPVERYEIDDARENLEARLHSPIEENDSSPDEPAPDQTWNDEPAPPPAPPEQSAAELPQGAPATQRVAGGHSCTHRMGIAARQQFPKPAANVQCRDPAAPERGDERI